MTAFEAVEPAFEAERLASIALRFDGSRTGAVYLDDVGFIRR